MMMMMMMMMMELGPKRPSLVWSWGDLEFQNSSVYEPSWLYLLEDAFGRQVLLKTHAMSSGT